MRPRLTTMVGIFCAVGSAVGMGFYRYLDVTHGAVQLERDPVGEFLLGLAFMAYPIVGAVIVWRQPRHAMGWIFCAVGIVTALGGASQAYTEHILPGLTDVGALGYATAWVANWWWYTLLGIALIFVPSLFPTGRLLSPRWRFVFWPGAFSMAGVSLIGMVQPRLVATGRNDGILYNLDNPIGIAGLGDPEHGAIGTVLLLVELFSVAAAVLSLIVRFKRSRGVERQQLKWITYAAALIPITTILADYVPWIGETSLPFAVVVGALPVAAGFAILRYRLYDIDLIINRTLVYGALTAILAGTYVGIVFGLQAILSPVTQQSDIAIAASTLAVAALFRPLRSRVQGFIDRRFYRRKFSTQVTLEDFSAHVRDEVELDSLSEKLVGVIAETMQPTHVSLWLRADARELSS